ncbi:MAG: hypothetical protein AAF806_19845 [Bacteroidota bacterium]
MVDIAYIVSHGFAARMLTQTNLLGKLVEKGLKVALITPDKEDENLRNYCGKAKVELFEFNPSSSFWTSQYGNARKYFLEDIRNNTALWEKHLYSTQFNKSKRLWGKIQPRLFYLAYLCTKWFPSLRNWYKKREDKYLESESATHLIQKINPKTLVATYPVNFREGMLLKAAKQQHKKTVIHLLSWDNISCKGRFPALADEYIAWGAIMKAEFMEYYDIPANKIHTCGVPHFDLHIESRKHPKPQVYLEALGLNPEQSYLFFGMSSPRFAPREIDIVEHLAQQVQQNIFGEEMQLIVRPHPQNVQGNMADQSWLPRLEAINKGKVAVDFPNLVKSNLPWSMQQQDMSRLSQLLAGCTVSMNSGSTLSIDALMCGVPVILTSFDGDEKLAYWQSARRLIDYPHLKKLVYLGGVSIVDSFDDLFEMIKKYIENPNFNAEKRSKTLAQQCDNYESFSTPKVVNQLQALVRLDRIN